MVTSAYRAFKREHPRRLRLGLAGSLVLCFLLFLLYPSDPGPLVEASDHAPVFEMVILDEDSYSVPQLPTIEHPVVPVAHLEEPVYDVYEDSDIEAPADVATPPRAVPVDEAVLEFDTPPRAFEMVRPEYPMVLRKHWEEGLVILRVHVGKGGRVEDAYVLQSSSLLLEAPTVAAVRQWIFRPAEKDGEPVRASIILPLEFRLQ